MAKSTTGNPDRLARTSGTGDNGRWYISGPIKGDTDYRAKFAKAEKNLARRGFRAVNPVKVGEELERQLMKGEGRKPTRREYLEADLIAIMGCFGLVSLPGWSGSEGAQMEMCVASALGMPVKDIWDLLAEKLDVDKNCGDAEGGGAS